MHGVCWWNLTLRSRLRESLPRRWPALKVCSPAAWTFLDHLRVEFISLRLIAIHRLPTVGPYIANLKFENSIPRRFFVTRSYFAAHHARASKVARSVYVDEGGFGLLSFLKPAYLSTRQKLGHRQADSALEELARQAAGTRGLRVCTTLVNGLGLEIVI